jgi:hypothetical protein
MGTLIRITENLDSVANDKAMKSLLADLKDQAARARIGNLL